MKRLLIFTISIAFITCNNLKDQGTNPVSNFQKQIIKEGLTGSNVAMLYRNGEIIYNEVVNSSKTGDKDINSETIFAIHSMSKTITTVAMMILLDKKLYDLEDNLSKYLPEFKSINCKGDNGVYPCKNKLKIIHLLTHRSGYTYYARNGKNWLTTTYTDLYPNYINTSRFDNLDDFSKAVAKIPLDFEPGTMYAYGLNQAILGRLIEVISGKSFFTFLNENIFEKLGMSETKFHLTDSERERLQPLRVNIKPNTTFNPTNYNLNGYTAALDGYSYLEDNKAHFGGEGLVSTMKDFAKFCEMLVNEGNFNGTQIVSKKGIEIMTRKYTNGYPDPKEPNTFSDLEGYYFGFTFCVLENPQLDGTGAPKGIYGWSGYNNTHFWIDPENKLFGLFMSRAIEFDFSILKRFKSASYELIAK